MRLSPLDIRKQEFKKVMRGLDQEEVDAFLSMVADEFEALIREKNQLSDDVLKLRTQLRDYQHVEATLRETLVSARQSVEESKANSQKEAEMTLREAELKAEQIIEDAKEELMELRNEIRLLKSQKDSFVKRLRYLLDSQLELIGTLEIGEPGNEQEKRTERVKMKGRLPRSQYPSEREPTREEEIAEERPSELRKEEPRIVPAAEETRSTEAPEFEAAEFESLEETESTEEKPESDAEDHRISNQFII